MSDYLVSHVRTLVPVAVGMLLTWLARATGVVLDEGTSAEVTLAVTSVVIAVYYAAARRVEQRWPGVGRWLLGAGRAPVYVRPDAEVRVDGLLRRAAPDPRDARPNM